jgi:hypothetical protein
VGIVPSSQPGLIAGLWAYPQCFQRSPTGVMPRFHFWVETDTMTRIGKIYPDGPFLPVPCRLQLHRCLRSEAEGFHKWVGPKRFSELFSMLKHGVF